MLALLDALAIPQASFVGHAAGAVAGLSCALRAPDRVRALVSVNGWAKADPHFLRCFEARLNLLRHVGVDAFLRAQPIFLYPANWISEHSAELDAELPSQRAHFPGVEAMEKRIAALAAFDIADRLSEIRKIQVLVYATLDDMLVPSNASGVLMDGLPQPFECFWDRGGHACNVTESDTFNREIINFLRS
jgi:aminoacrylate hydrolase